MFGDNDIDIALMMSFINKAKEEKSNPFSIDRKSPFNELKSLSDWDFSFLSSEKYQSKFKELDLLVNNFSEIIPSESQKEDLFNEEFKNSNLIEGIRNDNERLLDAWRVIDGNEISKELMAKASVGLNPDKGKFRKKKVFLAGNGKIHYTPPEGNRRIHSKIDNLLKYDFNGLNSWVHSILFHIQYELIHPLLDGNGRTGRLYLQHMTMNKLNLDFPLLISENLYGSKQDYYKAINNPVFIREWDDSIDYFLKIYEDAIIDTLNFIE